MPPKNSLFQLAAPFQGNQPNSRAVMPWTVIRGCALSMIYLGAPYRLEYRRAPMSLGLLAGGDWRNRGAGP
jgi:hypothetical protein